MQYEDYKTIHEKVKTICDFINNNNYLKLRDEVITLKNKIVKLDISNWSDSNYELFEKERINYLNIINLVIDSIDTLYRYSETIYKQLLISLNNLETNFNEDDKTLVDSYLKTLKEINQSQINVSDFSLDTTIDLGNIQMSSNLATNQNENTDTFEFNGNKYVVVKTNNGYQNVLTKIGKQNPDGCLNYSLKYSDEIFNDSNSNKIMSYQSIGSNNEQDTLKVMANEVLEGRPCVIRVNGAPKPDGYTRHFVAVTGLREGADLDNLHQEDFLIMDPNDATLKTLDTNRADVYAKNLLQTSEDVNWRNHGSQGYLCLIFNNPSTYLDNNANLYRGSF